jgi:hypothetical protein
MQDIDCWTADVNSLSRSLHSSDRCLSRRPKTTLATASSGAIDSASTVSIALREPSTTAITVRVRPATTVETSTLRMFWQP